MQILTNQERREMKEHGSGGFPFLVSHERLSAYDTGSFLWHWHPEIEITLVQSGEMTYRVNRFCYDLKAGDILFENSNALHAGSRKHMRDCEYIAITFDPKLIYGFSKSSIHTRYVEPVLQDFSLSAVYMDGSQAWHENFGALLQEMIMLAEEQPLYYEMDVVTRLQALWKLLLINAPVAGRESALQQTEYERMLKIIAWVEEHYREKFTWKEVSAHLHLCESECSRLFKRYMNVSLFSFLQEYRVERSLEYLNRQEPIGRVAQLSGFSDSNYYAKVFAKRKGCSPREYRRRQHGTPDGL